MDFDVLLFFLMGHFLILITESILVLSFKPVVLNSSDLVPPTPQDMWQCMQTFLVVTIGGGGSAAGI